LHERQPDFVYIPTNGREEQGEQKDPFLKLPFEILQMQEKG